VNCEEEKKERKKKKIEMGEARGVGEKKRKNKKNLICLLGEKYRIVKIC
jgi:hypothetical protein